MSMGNRRRGGRPDEGAPPATDRVTPAQTQQNDALTAAFSERALDALEKRVRAVVERELRKLIPKTIEQTRLSPWLDTKHAAAYIGISENALRLRIREGLVPAHRDGAGRLRFHRDELDQSMRPEPARRRRR